MKKKSLIISTLMVTLALLAGGSLLAQKNPKDTFTFPKLNPLKVPEVKKVTLKNGIRLFLIEDHSFPTIDLQGLVFTGSVFEPADKAGLASLTGTVLRTGGAAARSGDQIDRELETMAASIETGIDSETGSISISMLRENIDAVLAILADILKNPLFDQGKIDLAKIELRSMISRRNDDVKEIARREFKRLIYGPSSPYVRQPDYATVEAVTRDDMVAFFQKFYFPNNLWLAVWGDFNTPAMIAKLEKTIGKWSTSGSPLPPLPPVGYGYPSTVNYIDKPDVNQSNIAMGHIGGLLSDPDFPALEVMNRILTFDRMFKRIRNDEGLAYEVWGNYGAGLKVPGTLSIGAQTKSGSTVKTIRIMKEEIARFTREEVSDEELKRAKEQYLNSYVFQYDSRVKIINRMLALAFYGYPLDFMERLFADFEKVTKADILRAAKKHLKPDQVQILVVGKKGDFDKPLAELGNVNVIDITIPMPKGEQGPQATPESLAKGQELFARVIGAIGDPAKMSEIRTVHSLMSIVQATPMGEMAMDAEMHAVFPDKIHFALNTPQGRIAMIVNGSKGVIQLPQGSMPLPEAQRKSLVENLLRNEYYIWQNKDKYTFQYLGKKKRGEQEVIDLLISGPLDPFHWYIDPQTLLPIGATFQTMGQAGPETVDEYYSDYRKVEGVMMAFKSESFVKETKQSQQNVKEIKLNAAVADELFKID